jgi:hypothetical protein
MDRIEIQRNKLRTKKCMDEEKIDKGTIKLSIEEKLVK